MSIRNLSYSHFLPVTESPAHLQLDLHEITVKLFIARLF